MHSFDILDVEKDYYGEWHCPVCWSTHVMKHERCRCDEPTASGTIYRVHYSDELGNEIANCWPTYVQNANKRVFECGKCRTQFDIGLCDTTEDTETQKAAKCSFLQSQAAKC